MRYIIFVIFVALFMALTKAQVSINGITLPLRSLDDRNDLEIKRAEQVTFQWPRVDGPPQNFPDLKLLAVGYWTFNTTFLKSMESLNLTDPMKAAELLFGGLVEYEYKWFHECWKMSNASAKAESRTNTLARVVVFPTDDPALGIDPIYQLATPMMLACWERAKDGDINVAVKNHTQDLINSLKWDKTYALSFIDNQKKDFAPIAQLSANSTLSTATDPSKGNPSSSKPGTPDSSNSFHAAAPYQSLFFSVFAAIIFFMF